MSRPQTSKPRGVCRYFTSRTGCRAGDSCKFLHGTNEMLTPYDKSKTCKFWNAGYCRRGESCWFRHELSTPGQDLAQSDQSPPEALVTAEDDLCSICFEKPVTYGLLVGCSHIFCIKCIREWRNSKNKDPEATASRHGVKSCPLCRQATRYILPSSHFYPEGSDAKNEALAQYKASMARVPCRYFQESLSRGRPSCHFGKDCFYQHLNPDGTEHVFHHGIDNPPWRRPTRHNRLYGDWIVNTFLDFVDGFTTANTALDGRFLQGWGGDGDEVESNGLSELDEDENNSFPHDEIRTFGDLLASLRFAERGEESRDSPHQASGEDRPASDAVPTPRIPAHLDDDGSPAPDHISRQEGTSDGGYASESSRNVPSRETRLDGEVRRLTWLDLIRHPHPPAAQNRDENASPVFVRGSAHAPNAAPVVSRDTNSRFRTSVAGRSRTTDPDLADLHTARRHVLRRDLPESSAPVVDAGARASLDDLILRESAQAAQEAESITEAAAQVLRDDTAGEASTAAHVIDGAGRETSAESTVSVDQPADEWWAAHQHPNPPLKTDGRGRVVFVRTDHDGGSDTRTSAGRFKTELTTIR